MASNGKAWAWIVTAGALLMGAGFSCGDSGAGSSDMGFSVQDSSGVATTINTGPDLSLPIREVLRFGVLMGDPRLQFHGIRDLAIDSLGGIWVCDSYEAIRHYSASGEYLGQVGGRGQGPGEAPYGYGAVWVGPGTVLAYASGASLQVFDADGGFLGSRYPFPDLETPRILHPLGPTENGWLFNRKDFPPPADPSPRTSWVVGRGPLTTAGFDSVLALDGEPMVGRGNEWSHGSFFDGTPSIAVDALGKIYYSDPFEYRIEAYASSGHLERVVRRRMDRVPFDDGIRGEVEAAARHAIRELNPTAGTSAVWSKPGSKKPCPSQTRPICLPSTSSWFPAMDTSGLNVLTPVHDRQSERLRHPPGWCGTIGWKGGRLRGNSTSSPLRGGTEGAWSFPTS